MSGGPSDPALDDGASDPHVRAGELVLGLLSADEAAAVRRAAMIDLDIADAIVRWEVRFSPLAAFAGERAPPPELFARIERSIGGAGSVPLAANSNVAPMTPGGGRTRLWQAATAAALALAAALAFAAYFPRAAAPMQIAALVPANAPKPAFVAQVGGENIVVVSAVAPAAVPSGRDLELWLLPPGASKPLSLGVLPASGRTVKLPGPQPTGTQLLVSLEPRGGSPTGLPTGEVLYVGALSPG